MPKAIVGPQIVEYTEVVAGGGGGLVGPGAAPTGSPALALASGAGIETGAHSYAASFVTASGESLAGPVTSITVGALTARRVRPRLARRRLAPALIPAATITRSRSSTPRAKRQRGRP